MRKEKLNHRRQGAFEEKSMDTTKSKQNFKNPLEGEFDFQSYDHFLQEPKKKVCLYSIFNISKSADSENIRRAYYKASLRCHPDRCPLSATEREKYLATEMFKWVTRAYSILSNDELKSQYDNTGIIPDENDSLAHMFGMEKDQMNWFDYFQSIFEKVSIDMLDETKINYQGTKEEENDILNYYEQFEGDFNSIMDNMLFSSSNEESRYSQIINEAIRKGKVKEYPKYKKTLGQGLKRKKKADKEEKEAMAYAKELNISLNSQSKKSSGDSLLSSIQSRHKEKKHDEFLEMLAGKYGKKNEKKSNQNRKKKPLLKEDKTYITEITQKESKHTSKKKSIIMDPLSDEQFEALQNTLFNKKNH